MVRRRPRLTSLQGKVLKDSCEARTPGTAATMRILMRILYLRDSIMMKGILTDPWIDFPGNQARHRNRNRNRNRARNRNRNRNSIMEPVIGI